MKGGKITKEHFIAFQPFFFIYCFSFFLYLFIEKKCLYTTGIKVCIKFLLSFVKVVRLNLVLFHFEIKSL